MTADKDRRQSEGTGSQSAVLKEQLLGCSLCFSQTFEQEEHQEKKCLRSLRVQTII